jgi:hypothetical protein
MRSSRLVLVALFAAAPAMRLHAQSFISDPRRTITITTAQPQKAAEPQKPAESQKSVEQVPSLLPEVTLPETNGLTGKSKAVEKSKKVKAPKSGDGTKPAAAANSSSASPPPADTSQQKMPLVEPGPTQNRYPLSETAIRLRESLLKRCLSVYNNYPLLHTTWYERPEAVFHVLGSEEYCSKNLKYSDKVLKADHTIYYIDVTNSDLIEREFRRLADGVHVMYYTWNTDGTQLNNVSDVVSDSTKFVEDVDGSRPLEEIFPVRDRSTSQIFFNNKNGDFAFLRSIQASGFVDRIALGAELISDRIGWGRLSLVAAFGGVTSNSSTDAGNSSNTAKDNLEKFLAVGGDFGLTYELPIFFLDNFLYLPGFLLVEAYPKFVSALPGLNSSVKDASAAFEPAMRIHFQVDGFDNNLAPYVESTAGWAIGMGPGWAEYLGIRHFGFMTITGGILVQSKFNIGVRYLLAGPLRGTDGISITVGALTTN